MGEEDWQVDWDKQEGVETENKYEDYFNSDKKKDLAEKMKFIIDRDISDPGATPACFKLSLMHLGASQSTKYLPYLIKAHSLYARSVETVIGEYLDKLGFHEFTSSLKTILDSVGKDGASEQLFKILESVNVKIAKISDKKYEVTWSRGSDLPQKQTVNFDLVYSVNMYG
jgi:hypothetical protein